MTNEENLKYHESRLKDLLIHKQSLEYAIIIIDADRRKTRDGVQMAIEEFKREADDERFIIEEIRIHIEKEKNG